MKQTIAYPSVDEFNQKQSEMTSQGFTVRSVDYEADHISVLWHRHEHFTFRDDGTLTDKWVRARFVIRRYASADELASNPLQGFSARNVHHMPGGVYVLWCTSLYPVSGMGPDSARYRERWQRSPRFREAQICRHNTDKDWPRRYYYGDGQAYCLCAICGERFPWNGLDS